MRRLLGSVALALVVSVTLSAQIVIRHRDDPDQGRQVLPSPQITTSTIPAATEGAACSVTLATNGAGAPPYTFTLAAGAVPTGATLNQSTGVISGTCSAAGTFAFTVRVEDAQKGASAKALTWTVNASAAADFYVATTGTNNANCGAAGAPCATVAYVLSNRTVTNKVIEVASGTYTGGWTVTASGVTIRGSSSGLVWTCGSAWVEQQQTVHGQTDPSDCGIVSGTDTRPLFTSRIDLSGNGVTLAYVRVRGASSPQNDIYSGVVAANADNVTIHHCEIFNGNQGVAINYARNTVVRNNHIHDCGVNPSSTDTHGVQLYYSGGTKSTSFTTAVQIRSNTIGPAISGDAIQEGSAAYGCGGDGTFDPSCTFAYLIVEYNELYDTEEQCLDFKGTQQVQIHGNDCHGSGDAYGGVTFTWDPPTQTMSNYDIWDNYFHDNAYLAISWSQSVHCSGIRVWNNTFVRNLTAPPSGFNAGAVQMCGDAASYTVFNTFVSNDNGSTGPRTWAVKDGGSGANVRNNVFYLNGTGTDDRRAISAISGEDSGTPVSNYISPSDTNGGLAKTGSPVVTTCYATGNCPGFTNMATDDYSLVSGSPARSAGAALSSHVSLTDTGNFTPSIDALGHARNASAPDLGAFTYVP
jgi:hypothetical protein